MPHRRALLAAPLLGSAARPGAAQQQQAQAPWPSRTLRMVIPWPPGQSTDVQGRLMAQWLSDRLGQTVVPENRPGAGGQIGTNASRRRSALAHLMPQELSDRTARKVSS